jgi:hypothetical protein
MALYSHGLKEDIKDVEKSVSKLEEERESNNGFGNGGPGMGMTPPDWNSGNGDSSGNNDFYGGNGNGNNWGDDDWDYDDDDNWSGSSPGNQQDSQNSQNGQQSSSGVSIGIVISDNNGVYISQVTGSNAKSAGFQEGDKIVEFDGEDIDNSNELIEEVQEHKSGDKVTVVVERHGKEQKITTTLE